MNLSSLRSALAKWTFLVCKECVLFLGGVQRNHEGTKKEKWSNLLLSYLLEIINDEDSIFIVFIAFL